MTLERLAEDGHRIPDLLPATFIECRNKKEAAKLVLIYSSIYARITEMGLIDFMKLQELNYDELKFEIDLPGLDRDDFETFRDKLKLTDDEFTPPEPETVVTDIQVGDIFDIGKHRLLCGDCRDPDEVGRLMEGEQLDLVVTDPPYNVDYQGKGAEPTTIMNDSMEDTDFYKFLLGFYKAFAEHTRPGGAWYVWHADSEGMNFRKAFLDSGLMLKQCLIWVKNALVLGRQDYQWRHEPCLYGWKPGAAHYFTDDRSISTVIEQEPLDLDQMKKPELLDLLKKVLNDLPDTVLRFKKPMRNDVHPTMKPVLLIGAQVANSSQVNDLVGDAFGGSGTTMVVCEQIQRRCRMMELDPKFCQVILDRMQQLNPELTITRNGQPYTRHSDTIMQMMDPEIFEPTLKP